VEVQGWRPSRTAQPSADETGLDVRRGPTRRAVAAAAVAAGALIALMAVVVPRALDSDDSTSDRPTAQAETPNVPAWTRPALPVIEPPRRFATGVVRAWGGPDLVRPDQVHVWVLQADASRGALVTVDALGRVPQVAGEETVDVVGTPASVHRDDGRDTTILEWNVPGGAVSVTATGLSHNEVTRLAEGVFVPQPSAEGQATPSLRWVPDDMEVVVERSATAALSGALLHPVGGTGVGGIHAEFLPGPGQDLPGGFSVSAARHRAVTASDLAAAMGRRARLVSLPGGRTGVVFGPPLREGTVLVVDGGQGVTLSARSDLLPPNELLTAVADLDLDALTAAAVAQSGGKPTSTPAGLYP
jgi:hypothetical protein